MPKPSRTRAILAGTCTGLGTLWAAAGVLKLIFGTRITLILFPPLDLERVAAWPAVAIGLLLVFLGAWLQRSSAAAVPDNPRTFANDIPEPLPNAHLGGHEAIVERKQPVPVHRAPLA
jgi:hypothetical protein